MQTKVCTKCREAKTIDQFSKRSSAPDGLQHQCKSCGTGNCRNHYLNHTDVYKQKNGQKRTEIRARLRAEFLEFKQTLSCGKCGEDRYYCLDFHHKDPNEKEHNLSAMMHSRYSLKRMKEEAAKCDVLCRNCHAEVHHLERLGVGRQIDPP